SKLTREQIRIARDLRSAFIDYLIPVMPLVTDDIQVVTRTFKRINSAGTPMSDLHMARALAWGKDFDLIEEIDKMKEQLSDLGWREVDTDVVLKVVATAAGLEPTDFDVEALAKDLVERRGVERGTPLGDSLVVLRVVIEVLGEMGIAGPKLLPGLYALVVPSAALLVGLRARLPIDNRGTRDALAAWLAPHLLAEHLTGTSPHTIRKYRRELEAILGYGKAGATRTSGAIKVQECMKFNLAWSRSRVTAVVLAEQHPQRSDGNPLDGPAELAARGNAAVSQFLLPDAPGIQKVDSGRLRESSTLTSALAHPANRIIAEEKDVATLRKLLLYGQPSNALLQSHLISLDAYKALQQRTFHRFFELRRKAIRQAELDWVKQHGGEAPSFPKTTELWR
ncbi:MAG TPA: hypothetical protein PLA94_14885, partial [Myxococcota bacterium]|nr:hypothetical protein [Myxococcota bacterium]